MYGFQRSTNKNTPQPWYAFKAFLKKHEADEKFSANCDYTEVYCNRDGAECIAFSFTWEEAPEGHIFWNDLNEAWAKQFNKRFHK